VKELNLILLGPPGAGKGTQAERLQQDFTVLYLSTGNMLRSAVEHGTELGQTAKSYMDRGELVPDEVITGVVMDCVRSDAAAGGFLLDGFPRTLPQAQSLGEALDAEGRSLTAALLIDVPDEIAIKRISGRRQSIKSGRVYNIYFDPPKNEGVCDVDGSRLVQRDDDDEDTVRNRLEVYRNQTAPLVDYYEERGLLKRFDGSRSPTEVHDHIRATLATLRLEEQI
jgi:adenylate kinase